MKKIHVVEVQVVVAIPDESRIGEEVARVTEAAVALKRELVNVAQFNVLTREVTVQEAPDAGN